MVQFGSIQNVGTSSVRFPSLTSTCCVWSAKPICASVPIPISIRRQQQQQQQQQCVWKWGISRQSVTVCKSQHDVYVPVTIQTHMPSNYLHSCPYLHQMLTAF